MSISERTIACPICREPYKVYAYSAADQSACPSCVNKAESRIRRNHAPITDFRDIPRETQQEYLGKR